MLSRYHIRSLLSHVYWDIINKCVTRQYTIVTLVGYSISQYSIQMHVHHDKLSVLFSQFSVISYFSIFNVLFIVFIIILYYIMIFWNRCPDARNGRKSIDAFQRIPLRINVFSLGNNFEALFWSIDRRWSGLFQSLGDQNAYHNISQIDIDFIIDASYSIRTHTAPPLPCWGDNRLDPVMFTSMTAVLSSIMITDSNQRSL